MTAKLTKQDVERLLTDPSSENRADTAAKLASDFHHGALGDHERAMAVEIFGLMVEDAAERVRQALAEHLKECRDIPRAIARRLAADVDTVAVPMLRHSELLTDDDLLAIVRSSGEAKQCAIAARPSLSDTVAGSLVEQGSEAVVTRVMENPSARLSEATLTRVMDLHGDSSAVSTAVTRRALLPMSIAERLVAAATENLQRQLADRNDVSPDAMADLVMGIRERATLSLVNPRIGIGDARRLVDALDERGRLTASIVIRGLCMGDIAFFEAAMARLARLPMLNAQVLIHDEGRRGLEALWRKAGMPEALLRVGLAAIEASEEIEYDGEPHDRERYRRRVIERVLTRCDEDSGLDLAMVAAGDLEYLLAKLGEFRAADTVGHP